MGRWTSRAKTPEEGRETTGTTSQSGGWLTRAFAKATGRTSGRGGRDGREERKAFVHSGATPRGMTTEGGVEGTTTAAAAGERVDAREGTGKGARGTTKKMRVEDFEPLKLIGRGAFGA